MPAKASAPAPAKASAPAAPVAAAVPVKAPDLTFERLPSVTDSLLQIKMDSLSGIAESGGGDLLTDEQRDSLTKATGDAALKAIQEGKYISRAEYDKTNFDHWKIDTVYQKQMKATVLGEWRTNLIAHGHAFRDASLRFANNDTLYGVTRTYSDSGRYQMTGEYKFQARYRFDNDSTIVSREVFVDRNVVRWDHISFHIKGNKLSYHLSKLEFRDLNDNWLNALQGFEHVEPEIYLRITAPASVPAAK